MANTFKNKGVAIGNTATVIYTTPGGTSTVVLDKPVNLEAADILKATADAASTLQAFCSILEIT